MKGSRFHFNLSFLYNIYFLFSLSTSYRGLNQYVGRPSLYSYMVVAVYITSSCQWSFKIQARYIPVHARVITVAVEVIYLSYENDAGTSMERGRCSILIY